jgi:hypothetical protein
MHQTDIFIIVKCLILRKIQVRKTMSTTLPFHTLGGDKDGG